VTGLAPEDVLSLFQAVLGATMSIMFKFSLRNSLGSHLEPVCPPWYHNRGMDEHKRSVRACEAITCGVFCGDKETFLVAIEASELRYSG
jgi:hypothetical protein